MDSTIFTNGKHMGKTFVEVKNNDPTYFIFLISLPIINLKKCYILFINYNYYNINNYNFNIGKHKGKTFNHVRKNYPMYFIFLSSLNKYNLNNEYILFINYCKLYLTQN